MMPPSPYEIAQRVRRLERQNAVLRDAVEMLLAMAAGRAEGLNLSRTEWDRMRRRVSPLIVRERLP